MFSCSDSGFCSFYFRFTSEVGQTVGIRRNVFSGFFQILKLDWIKDLLTVGRYMKQTQE